MKNTKETPLQLLSESLAETVDSVGRGVVRVEARRRGHASGVLWSADGLVVTAHHAVQRDSDIRVGLPGGDIVEAQLLGRDPATDLAVLRIEEPELELPIWAEDVELRVGHLVLSVGRHDRYAQASLGIVSKREEEWRTSAGGKVDAYIQTDIPVYPGFSGSALVDAEGRVVGMNSSWLRRRLSLTLPYPTVNRVVSHLVEHGRMKQGYLGIGAYPVRLPKEAAQELGQKKGLLIVSVEPDSPADEAGLLVGDLLTGFADTPLNRLDDLLALLADDSIGQEVSIRYIRAGVFTESPIVIGERA